MVHFSQYGFHCCVKNGEKGEKKPSRPKEVTAGFRSMNGWSVELVDDVLNLLEVFIKLLLCLGLCYDTEVRFCV